MNLDLESVFINKYVVKDKRKRYLGFIGNSKRRGTFLGMLYHGRDLDKTKFKKVSSFHETGISEMPSNTSCYIISVKSVLDGQEMSVKSALDKINGYTEGTVLIFGKCELIYYYGEPPHNEYVSI